MKVKPTTEYILLGILMTGPKHGYEIMRFLKDELGVTWYVGTSQLYALLKRLDRDGLISSTLEAQETRPSKRVVSLTPAGKRDFLKWLHSPTEHVRDLRIEFLAKLFFFQHLEIKGGDELIDAQVRILESTRRKLKENYVQEEKVYKKLVIGCKITSLESWLDWLGKEVEPFIKSTKGNPQS